RGRPLACDKQPALTRPGPRETPRGTTSHHFRQHEQAFSLGELRGVNPALLRNSSPFTWSVAWGHSKLVQMSKGGPANHDPTLAWCQFGPVPSGSSVLEQAHSVNRAL